MQLGRFSGIKYIPVTGKPTKYSGKTCDVLAAINLILPDPSKTKMVPNSATRRISSADGEYFKDLLKSVVLTPLHTQDVHLGDEKIITAAEVSVAVKTLNAAYCD